jgi:nitrogen regulatory protein PII
MMLVIAYVQPFVADKVMAALHAVPGVSGATFVDARGFGRGQTTERPTTETLLGVSPKLRIEVAIEDRLENAVVAAIVASAWTGHRGDGKVFVMPLLRATRVATGETGTSVA